jgi:hypothetical protein
VGSCSQLCRLPFEYFILEVNKLLVRRKHNKIKEEEEKEKKGRGRANKKSVSPGSQEREREREKVKNEKDIRF